MMRHKSSEVQSLLTRREAEVTRLHTDASAIGYLRLLNDLLYAALAPKVTTTDR